MDKRAQVPSVQPAEWGRNGEVALSCEWQSRRYINQLELPLPVLTIAAATIQRPHMVDKDVPNSPTMSVSDGNPVMAESAPSTSHVFLDNNASLKKTKRKRTRYGPGTNAEYLVH